MRILLILFLCMPFALFSQTKIHGYVLEATRNTPLAKASVFLNNTSIGTTTNESGYFELTIPVGKFELIASSIGFATYQKIITQETPVPITIKLSPKAAELEEVVIEVYEKNGWKKWGNWFYEQFIGNSSYGNSCKILNPDVIRFKFNEKTNVMRVIAKEPLIIENKALGYRIRYQLEIFQYEFRERRLFYAGFPFFQELEGKDRKKQQWVKAREEAYYGSVMHFMRALFANRINEEGYAMRYLYKSPNVEKERVRQIYRKRLMMNRGMINVGGDSTAYYNRIMNEPDVTVTPGRTLLTRDSLGYMKDSTQFILKDTNYVYVLYRNKTVPFEYKQLYPKNGSSWASEMVLVNNEPIELFANGSYFNPTDLMFGGFWGWWEKISTMLPMDY